MGEKLRGKSCAKLQKQAGPKDAQHGGAVGIGFNRGGARNVMQIILGRNVEEWTIYSDLYAIS